ncbi:MAG: hypothetical protein QXF25_01030 [Candidatus Pacearchaeota archaeon]
MATEYFYPGATYPLQSEYSSPFTGYGVSASSIGLTTDARTANQIADVSKKLNVGVRTIELSMLSPQVFQSIPEQHIDEIRRLSKLTGAEFTMHGPIIDPAGFDQNMKWSENSREMTEKEMLFAIERAHKINSEGNMPVTFHSSVNIPEGLTKVKTEKVKEGEEVKSAVFVDPMTGKLIGIEKKEKFFPEKELEIPFEERELQKINEESWLDTLNQLTFYASRGEDHLENAIIRLKGGEKELGIEEKEEKEFEKELLENWAKGKKMKEEKFQEALETFRGKEIITPAIRELDHAQVFLMDSYNHLKALFERVYPQAKFEEKEALKNYAEEIKPLVQKGIEKDPEKIREFAEMIEKGIRVLKGIQPQIYKKLDEFVIDKASDTFSNVAFQAWQKYKDKTPIIAIENPPAGSAISRAEELKELIEEAREKFIKKAKEKGIPESEAKKAAEKIIGATWDVGHINMLRRYGYGKEELIEETAKIAPLVKKVHLSDNFGLEHTELPMGMGTVPIKEMIAKLEKEGVAPKKIIEAINWYEHFKTIPIKETLAGMGARVYTTAPPGPPYWAQAAGTYGRYFAGYGTIFPEEHVTMYGAGFAGLPTELGGQISGKQTRFSGTPME